MSIGAGRTDFPKIIELRYMGLSRNSIIRDPWIPITVHLAILSLQLMDKVRSPAISEPRVIQGLSIALWLQYSLRSHV